MTLNEYKDQRIKALEDELYNMNMREDMLTTFLFEVLDGDCPKEYKDYIKKVIFGKEDTPNSIEVEVSKYFTNNT